jgi:hypothetical protein
MKSKPVFKALLSAVACRCQGLESNVEMEEWKSKTAKTAKTAKTGTKTGASAATSVPFFSEQRRVSVLIRYSLHGTCASS